MAASWTVGLRRDSVITWVRPWYTFSNSPSLNVNMIHTCLGRTSCCQWLIFSWKTRGKLQALCCYGIGEFASKQYFTPRRGIIVEFSWYCLVRSSSITDWYFSRRHALVLEFPLLLWEPGLHRTELLSATDFENQSLFGRRSSYSPSCTSTLDGDWWSTLRLGRLSSRKISAVLIVQETGWAPRQVWKIPPSPTRIRSPDRPARRVAHG